MSSIALITPIDYLENAESYFLRIMPLGKRVWLDSGKPACHYGNSDILSAAPLKELINPSTDDIEYEVAQLCDQQTLAQLQRQNIPFWGGAIGFFNYEHNALEYNISPSEEGLRPSIFGIFDWALIQDHNQQRSFVVFLPQCSQEKRERILTLVNTPLDVSHPTFTVSNLASNLDKTSYCKILEKIQHYILAGDTYQINFSQRFSGNFKGDASAAYLALRRALPSPFSAYLELGDDQILSFSPERFISIDNKLATTQPIKGTAPRHENKREDKNLAESLINSEKNRAENLMIVDLLRNDFSKSCEPHSVKVPSLFALESYKNVHHLVSTVVGTIEKETSPLTFFRRCFPGGSITGAPKKRAMEIIRELEETPRNIYCGSICYLSCFGNFDSSITIRTVLVSEEKIYCWGGGGIVADSEPEEEYQESLQKIAVLIQTLKEYSAIS
ncbi:aminodeoxychorismate synthase component I [Agarilytica rhodophyticola]|uniref:aminodeoxychorismate synthase component I n=1 Tax=Agarilytica rhodophyticola TaxID=1737490 RepID=UPI000B347D74|nr:aminodeoxychorismate synthase component I [Agarilytica rhodophyticola]